MSKRAANKRAGRAEKKAGFRVDRPCPCAERGRDGTYLHGPEAGTIRSGERTFAICDNHLGNYTKHKDRYQFMPARWADCANCGRAHSQHQFIGELLLCPPIATYTPAREKGISR